MAYTPDFTEDDLAPIVVDGVAKTGTGVIPFTVIIGLLLAIGLGMAVYRWATRKKR